MKLITDTKYYESKNVRAYLKTRKGIYLKNLIMNVKKMNFY
jgi:hypothetical protein